VSLLKLAASFTVERKNCDENEYLAVCFAVFMYTYDWPGQSKLVNKSNKEYQVSPMMQSDKNERNENLPATKSEDVEFAVDHADEDDMEAVMRANAADRRQEQE
jgi:hypothetical protein